MIKRDNHEVFETGWASGYEQANKEWNEKIEEIRDEIIQDIQNGVIQITKGSEKLFEIIDRVGGESRGDE